MFCPSCGQEISDQAAFCPHCGTTTVGQPALAAPPKPRRSRLGCWLAAIGIVVLVLAILFGLWWFVGRRILTNQIMEQFAPTFELNLDFSPLRGAQITYTIGEDDLNDNLEDALPADIGPIEDLRVGLLPGGVRLHILAYGLESTLEAEIREWRGELQVTHVEAGGPLAWFLDPGIIAERVGKAINDELRENKIRLKDLRISPTGLTISIEPR